MKKRLHHVFVETCSVGCVAVCVHANQYQREYEWAGNAVKWRTVPTLITLRG